jgi:hypothetical protein
MWLTFMSARSGLAQVRSKRVRSPTLTVEKVVSMLQKGVPPDTIRFRVEQITNEVIDQATGQILNFSSIPVGEMVVTILREKFSEGPWVDSMQKDRHYSVRPISSPATSPR